MRIVPVSGFEASYHIRDNGDVLSLPKNGRAVKQLKRHTDVKTGYQSYFLYFKGTRAGKRMLIHRLVATAFISNPDSKPNVNHKDGNKKNNDHSNLEWCTHSENEIHAHATGLKNFKGENSNYKKLNNDDVLSIRNLYATGEFSQREIASEYNVTQSNVSRIVKNIRWSHI